MINWQELIEWVIGGIVTVFFSYMTFMFGRVVSTLDKMADSIEELNIKVARVIDRVELHEKRIDKLEDRNTI